MRIRYGLGPSLPQVKNVAAAMAARQPAPPAQGACDCANPAAWPFDGSCNDLCGGPQVPDGIAVQTMPAQMQQAPPGRALGIVEAIMGGFAPGQHISAMPYQSFLFAGAVAGAIGAVVSKKHRRAFLIGGGVALGADIALPVGMAGAGG